MDLYRIILVVVEVKEDVFTHIMNISWVRGGDDPPPCPPISTGPVRRARDTHHLKRKSYKEIAQNVVYLSTYILYYVSSSRPAILSVLLISIVQFTNCPKTVL